MATQNVPFGRFIPAMVTPFHNDLSLDLKRAQELALSLIARGADTLVICGTTGESPTLDYQEKAQLFRAVVEAVDKSVPVVANVGDNCTQHSVEFAREAASLGVDGIMAVVPYYNKPPQDGLYWHFRSIAESVELPVILYNIPGRCVINMESETTLRLAYDVPNIVAVKEASGKFDQIAEIIANAPEGFVVYSGDDEATLPIMGLGGYGVITTIGNVAPEPMKEIVDALVANEHTKALASHLKLQPLMKELFVTANPIMVKAAMEMAGFAVGPVRLPLIEATAKQKERLQKVMEAVGVL